MYDYTLVDENIIGCKFNVFLIWYKDILCKRLLGLWNLYIMNKAFKIHSQPESKTWLWNRDCVTQLGINIQAILYTLFQHYTMAVYDYVCI